MTQIIDKSEALRIAEEYGLTFEVESFIEQGYTPAQALYEWDIYPYDD